MPEDALEGLARLSSRVGRDIRLVQGGGGNTSVKIGDTLWVKASGTWLSLAKEEAIFLPLPLAAIRQRIAAGEADNLTDLVPAGSNLRPSIETTMHAVFPQRVVVHTHSVNALAWAVRRDGAQAMRDRMEGLRWAWIPYARPGPELCLAIMERQWDSDRNIQVAVLANHGVVIAAETFGEAEELLADVERRLARDERSPATPRAAALNEVNDLGWEVPKDPALHAVGTDAVTLRLARGGVPYPDHAVFLGRTFPQMRANERVSDAVRRLGAEWKGELPYLVLADAGILTSPGMTSGARAMLWALSLVGRRLDIAHEIQYLSAQEVDALVNWSAETFRRTVDGSRLGREQSK